MKRSSREKLNNELEKAFYDFWKQKYNGRECKRELQCRVEFRYLKNKVLRDRWHISTIKEMSNLDCEVIKKLDVYNRFRMNEFKEYCTKLLLENNVEELLKEENLEEHKMSIEELENCSGDYGNVEVNLNKEERKDLFKDISNVFGNDIISEVNRIYNLNDINENDLEKLVEVLEILRSI